MPHTVSVELDTGLLGKLDHIAAVLDRSRASTVADAVAQYVATYQSQIDEIEKGIADTNAGRVCTDEQVANYFRTKSHPQS